MPQRFFELAGEDLPELEEVDEVDERRVRLRHEAPLLLEPKGEPDGRAADKYFFYDEIAVPHDEEFSKIFKDDFLDHFHHNSSPEYPIFGLQRRQGSDTSPSESMSDLVLWPTVILHRLDIFLVVLPEVDGFPNDKYPLYEEKDGWGPTSTEHCFTRVSLWLELMRPRG